MTRVLCGVVDYGHGKAYVRDKFWEMAESCLIPNDGLDLVVASHDPSLARGHSFIQMNGHHAYVEDMLMEAREVMRRWALDSGYDKLMWQGIDALWQSREDVRQVLWNRQDIVAPLISARSDSQHAVARRFRRGINPFNLDGNGDLGAPWWVEEQDDIPEPELRSGSIVPAGFPGGDNIVLARRVLDRSWLGAHKPWYKRVADGETNIECIEWFCLDAIRKGYTSWVDTGVKVWHVHEDGIARMWKGIEKPMGELTWS